jgi:hypothetical protein
MTTEIELRMIAFDVANPSRFPTLPGWIQRKLQAGKVGDQLVELTVW